MSVNDGRSLPWRWLGRAIKPLTLCVLLATAASVWSEAVNSAGVYNLADPLGWIVTGFGLVAVLLLLAGVAGNSHRYERAGLYAAAWYWAWIGVFLLLAPSVAFVAGVVPLSLSGIAASLVLLDTLDRRLEGGASG